MYKKALLMGIIGYVAGCLIGLFFSLANEHFVLAESLPGILLGGLPGAIACGTTVVYSIEKWSLLRATVTHFLITMGVIILGSFVLKWFEPWSFTFWLMLTIELAGYILIWLIIYLGYKKQVRKMNEMLRECRKKEASAPEE